MDPNILLSDSSTGDDTPEQYIRTLESDIDVIQKGGTPGFALHKRPAPAPAERLIESSPLRSPQNPVVPPKIIITTDEPPKKAFTPDAGLLETYSDDFRKRLKETHASTATVIAAEQDAVPRAETATELEPTTAAGHGLWYIVAGILLLAVGGAGVYIGYMKYNSAIAPVITGPSTTARIFVDGTEEVAGSGTPLVQAIVRAAAQPLATNTVRQLIPASATSTANMFLLLGIPVPGILVRNLNESGNMAGIVDANGAQSPFFILSVALYSVSFSGMLAWETSMRSDLKALYPPYPSDVAPSGSATSTATTTKPTIASTTVSTVRKEGFRDEVVNNHDVRIYRDQKGRSILLYGFWNPTTLIIARDTISYAEILDRLSTSRAQ